MFLAQQASIELINIVLAVGGVVGTFTLPLYGLQAWMHYKLGRVETKLETDTRKISKNQKFIHDHLMQVPDTENPIRGCPFCNVHDRR